MDTYDLTQHGSLPSLFENIPTRFLVISFTSDWLYPSYQSLEIVSALRSRNCDVAYVNLAAVYGHDSFLVGGQKTRPKSFAGSWGTPGGVRWGFVKKFTGRSVTPSSGS